MSTSAIREKRELFHHPFTIFCDKSDQPADKSANLADKSDQPADKSANHADKVNINKDYCEILIEAIDTSVNEIEDTQENRIVKRDTSEMNFNNLEKSRGLDMSNMEQSRKIDNDNLEDSELDFDEISRSMGKEALEDFIASANSMLLQSEDKKSTPGMK